MKTVFLLLLFVVLGCSDANDQSFHFAGGESQESVEISLKDYGLTKVPKEIGNLKNVKRLIIMSDSSRGWTIYPPLNAHNLTRNATKKRSLPEEITGLKKLKTLALIGLGLTDLPEKFTQLQNLDSLDLSFNNLNISAELEQLKKLNNLTYLGLYGNQYDTMDINALKTNNPKLTIGIFYE